MDIRSDTTYGPAGIQTVATGLPSLNMRALEEMLAARWAERTKMMREEQRLARSPQSDALSQRMQRPQSTGGHGEGKPIDFSFAANGATPFYMSQVGGPGVIPGYVETNKHGLNTVAGGFR